MKAYLDHNILDLMTKGDPHNVKKLLSEHCITPVFSYESLNEIYKSKGYEDSFLAVLSDIGAKYLVPVTKNNRVTGEAELQQVDVFKLYEHYLLNREQQPEYGYGLTAMLQKFYGGRKDESYSHIFEKGTDELAELLQSSLEELKQNPLITTEQLQLVESLPEVLKAQYSTISEQMDSAGVAAVRDFESHFGVGPKTLNNIKGPNVINQIWQLLQSEFEKHSLESESLEEFFGLKFRKYEANFGSEKSTVEKVNAIYHQLNFIGFHRDSKMQKTARFNASFSDMTHAGLASFCELFFCRDNGLVHKASAAYEFLGINTKIVHFTEN
ncbi:hypothetical protein [Vibrio parahaemolyticus]|uniref:hypothetical protein n=1 Tax=Vibrio parahaemolyticus TaxID=670 RepID=UPI000416B55C|nr:hypothetical protein [Vibrio parahaemolyticus]